VLDEHKVGFFTGLWLDELNQQPYNLGRSIKFAAFLARAVGKISAAFSRKDSSSDKVIFSLFT